ncbi:MAG: hypothetical protein AOY29_05895 [Alcanivorax borkumensis]|uniref:Uncharacterized protein n=2 Tax=Alcanivorax borkumensis TaxID=59754 RepID=Q0VR27_ALCBS|nr:MAG: hypothetical protein AOY29_05895 [Alcanivorax borkumensis]CAL16371.1 hypothetical protein ABO_0923 [Alcanivorax borkumensis SK2]
MTDLDSTPLQLVLALFIFIAGLVFAVSVRGYFRAPFSRSVSLYLWHSFFCVIYLAYVLNYGGDASGYFRMSLHPDIDFAFGTYGVRFVVSFLSQGMGLSFLGCSLVFQLFGFIGLLAFDGALREVTWDKSRNIRLLATLIVFLPSVSFWSSGLGKDALSFCAMGLSLWAALSLKRRWWLLVLAVLLMLLVRPHMAGMLGLGLAGSFVFQRGIPLPQRVVLGGIALAAAVFLVPLGLNYAGVGEDAGADDVMQYIEGRQGHNLKGGGAVDISSMSPPVQMFTYLFRPTLIEARNLFSLAAALDNTILLFLFIAGGWAILKKPLPPHLLAHNRMFLWIYSLCAWLILAMTTANLGIALRQKWMFAPMLIFLLISVVGRSRYPAESDTPAVDGGAR